MEDESKRRTKNLISMTRPKQGIEGRGFGEWMIMKVVK